MPPVRACDVDTGITHRLFTPPPPPLPTPPKLPSSLPAQAMAAVHAMTAAAACAARAPAGARARAVPSSTSSGRASAPARRAAASRGPVRTAAAAEPATATKPLTKQDLVDYIRSGCKPKADWRCAQRPPRHHKYPRSVISPECGYHVLRIARRNQCIGGGQQQRRSRRRSSAHRRHVGTLRPCRTARGAHGAGSTAAAQMMNSLGQYPAAVEAESPRKNRLASESERSARGGFPPPANHQLAPRRAARYTCSLPCSIPSAVALPFGWISELPRHSPGAGHPQSCPQRTPHYLNARSTTPKASPISPAALPF